MTHIKMRLWLTLAALLALVSPLSAPAQVPEQGQPQQLQTTTLTAGMHLIRAQVAATSRQREIGLMFRRDMPVNDGMLFIFDEPQQQCFWMRNTLLPLTIAFLADDGSIVNMADMQPLTENSHCSTRPVRYVLEMNQGWFAKRGIKPGFKIGGAPFGRPAQ